MRYRSRSFVLKRSIGTLFPSIASFILLAAIYGGFILLLYLQIVPYRNRNGLLLVITGSFIAYTWYRRFSLADLGFSSDHLKQSLISNGIFTVIILLALFIAFRNHLIRSPQLPSYKGFFFYYVMISCPCQEFLFRAVIYAECRRRYFSRTFFILFSACIYSFLHIFYHDWITLAVTFTAGTIWGCIYSRHPNFWGVALSHAILGAASLFTGLV